MGILDALVLFATPNTPDLGCFVERKHGMEVINFNVHADPSPLTSDGQPLAHQAYFRIICSKAAFWQRCGVFARPSWDLPFPGEPPDWLLGGEFRPGPTDWIKFAPRTTFHVYWFRGDHSDPSAPSWRSDRAVGHIYDIYDNGTLSTVHFDDTGGDMDLNDLVLEVAIVRRSWLTHWPVAVEQAALNEGYEREVLPGLRELYRPKEG